MNEFHIDILLYGPTDKFPYWKMVTMGAGDYQMPPAKNTIARRNEYLYTDASVLFSCQGLDKRS